TPSCRSRSRPYPRNTSRSPCFAARINRRRSPAMTDWAKFFGPNAGLPPASEPLQLLNAFGTNDQIVDPQSLRRQGDAWRIDVQDQGFLARLLKRSQSVRLFEVDNPGVERCLLVYRAKMKTEGSISRAYLEMWCRLSGREYFSKGFAFAPAASGTTDW